MYDDGRLCTGSQQSGTYGSAVRAACGIRCLDVITVEYECKYD